MIPDDEISNFEAFRECVSNVLIQKLAIQPAKPKKRIKGRKNEIKPVERVEAENGDITNDAEELGDFIAVRVGGTGIASDADDQQYLAKEVFTSLPADLRTLSFAAVRENATSGERYSVPLDTAVLEEIVLPLPVSVPESLVSYGTIDEEADLSRFLEPVFSAYITASVAPPPEYTPALVASRPEGCEICQREHLPLTYHHLIPRRMHVKAVKRDWHKNWELNKVAWLCRACHSFVHKIASNEELAKELYSVELLTEREDVQKWAAWVGRVRWKAR